MHGTHFLFIYSIYKWLCVCAVDVRVSIVLGLEAANSLPFIALSVLMLLCGSKQPGQSSRFSGM